MKIHKTSNTTRITTSIIQSTLPKGQIKLNRRSVKKVIEFMKKLCDSPIPSKHIVFDKLDGDIARKPDLGMNLEKFLELLEKNKSRVDTFGLQYGDPDPHRILFVACFQDESNSTRFAWFSCIYNGNNVEIVNEIFKDIFGKSWEEF